VEHNSAPLELLSGDIIVLITDGIYKLLSDDEVREKLKEGQTLEDILKNIHSLTKQKAIANNVKQDNISIALIKIK
jgi:protein phosphatase